MLKLNLIRHVKMAFAMNFYQFMVRTGKFHTWQEIDDHGANFYIFVTE